MLYNTFMYATKHQPLLVPSERVSFALKVPLVSFSIEREDCLHGTTGVVDEHLIHCTLQLLSGAAVSLGREKSFEVSDKAYRREPGCREDNELVPIINVRGWFRGIVMRPFNQVRLLSIS